ncbi:MAG: VWA domain-containing protein [Lachnospiraceae bacterium]|nr:VWA domain-containing protein [Lachnospiraceae bacterium]
MGIGLQLLIGFAPLIIVALLFLIKRKLIIAPVVMIAGIGLAITLGFILEPKADKTPVEEMSGYDEMFYLAGSYIQNGKYDEAEKMLNDIYHTYGDTAKGALYRSRIKFLKGDYDSALVLYEKAKEIGDKDLKINDAEAALFAKIEKDEIVDTYTAAANESMIKYLSSQNLDPKEYGYENDMTCEEATKEFETGSKVILDSIEDDGEEIASGDKETYENIMDALELSDNVEDIYAEYVVNGTINEEKLDELFDDLDDIYKETPDVYTIDTIDEAYVRAATMLKKYKKLAEYADVTDSQLGITVIAGLYINETIKEKTFPDEFVTASKDQYEDVAKQCEKALDDVKDETEDVNVVSDCENMVNTIDTRKEDTILAELDSRINPDAVPLAKQSKVLLQSSNVSANLGDDKKAQESFKEALDKSVYSDDASYTEPMEKLIGIVNETGESQELANSKYYVEEAFKQSFPVKPNEEIKSNVKLENNATTYITTQLAMINIASVDTSKFPEITAQVQFGDPLDLDKINISVTDANVAIKDFTINKNSFEKAKIYLACDISGSMDGNEQALKDSVTKFVESMTSKEEVSILGFASEVRFDSGFMDREGNFQEYIDQLNPGGGTNIGAAAYASIDAFADAKDSFNVIVLMTDGQDGSFSGESSLVELRRRCEENNVILFTIGLGTSVNVEYLKSIAEYGNGSYMQSNDAASLEALYEFIHRQMENNYTLKFKAIDEVQNTRTLRITNNNDNSTGRRKYKLNYEIDDLEQAINEDLFVDLSGDAYIDGIDTPVVYKSPNVAPVINLIGKNLKKAEGITVTLSGTANYTTTAKVADNEHIMVTLPENIMLGRYSVNIVLDGQRFSLENALEVLDGETRRTITFGAYTFVASKIAIGSDKTVLTGNVVMNDFIRFKGQVVLEGDIKSQKVVLVDESGSYINFTKELPGLLHLLFANTLNLPAMQRLEIYNDQIHLADLDNYMVTEWILPVPLGYACVVYEAPSIALYPHKISISFGSVNVDLPFMDEIFEYNKVEKPFMVSGNAQGVITNETIGVTGEFNADGGDVAKLSIIPVALGEIKLKFDTLQNDYYFKIMITTDKIFKFQTKKNPDVDENGYGFDIGFKGGRWDQLTLYADMPITVCATPPVSLSDFMVGVEGLAREDQGASFGQRLWAATYKGGLDVSLCKLSDIIPALDAIFGDVALLTLDDTTLSLTFKNFAISATTTLKLFGYLDMGSVSMDIGNYEYANYLLGIPSSSTAGLRFNATQGPKIEIANFKIKAQGSSTITINDLFTGIWNRGDIEYSIKIIKKFSGSCNGNLLMGLHNNAKQFSIVIKGEDKKGNSDAGFKITFGGKKWPELKFY